MPTVHSEIKVSDVAIDTLWAVLADFEKYPSFMDDVQSVVVTNRADQELTSDWTLELDGTEFQFTEIERLDPENLRIEFEQVEGDLEDWRGHWQVVENDGSTLVQLAVTFDFGIPSLEAVLNPMGEKAIAQNCQQMLAAIVAQSQSSANA